MIQTLHSPTAPNLFKMIRSKKLQMMWSVHFKKSKNVAEPCELLRFFF